MSKYVSVKGLMFGYIYYMETRGGSGSSKSYEVVYGISSELTLEGDYGFHVSGDTRLPVGQERTKRHISLKIVGKLLFT